MAKHNAAVYGVIERIRFVHGDAFELAKTVVADAVFISPPWGGPRHGDRGAKPLFDPLKPTAELGRYSATLLLAWLAPCSSHALHALLSTYHLHLPVHCRQLANHSFMSISLCPLTSLTARGGFLSCCPGNVCHRLLPARVSIALFASASDPRHVDCLCLSDRGAEISDYSPNFMGGVVSRILCPVKSC
jgi:hypothetical protein